MASEQKQKTYYVREDLSRLIGMIASRDDKKLSDVVNDALEQYVNNTLTPDERRVFLKEKSNARGTGTSGDREATHTNGRGNSAGKAPGTKKRAG